MHASHLLSIGLKELIISCVGNLFVADSHRCEMPFGTHGPV
jgi:hypothetical protein